MRKILRKFIMWLIPELRIINQQLGEYKDLSEKVLSNSEISADIHERGDSWAVVSLRGHKRTYIKFIDLSDKDILKIAKFLSMFDRKKIDANPQVSKWICSINESVQTDEWIA